MAEYAANAGTADTPTAAILFTCSAFAPAIDKAKQRLNIPVLTPNEAAFDTALDYGSEIAIVVTFPPSADTLQQELAAIAANRGINVNITTHLAEGALAALQNGLAEEHDRLIRQTVERISGSEVIVLGQFSMARATAGITPRRSQRLLTTPDLAVQRLRQLVPA